MYSNAHQQKDDVDLSNYIGEDDEENFKATDIVFKNKFALSSSLLKS
jgi:hypothetical protein